MPNKLEIGKPRVGALVDFDESTPAVSVTLERTEQGVKVTIPWPAPDSPYARWFVADRFGVDPQVRLPVPERLLFQDSHGSVLLTGCRVGGYHANLLGPGSGVLWARAAVLNVDRDVDFVRPNGLKCEISGLREWLGVSSWNATHEWSDEEGSVVTAQSTTQPVITIGDFEGLLLEFVPAWHLDHQEARNRIVLHDIVRSSTSSKSPREWDAHARLHKAVRDLLALSRWHGESRVEVLVMHSDDPMRTMDGKTHGQQWRNVLVGGDEPARGPSGYRRHLYEFAELGPEGVARWVGLRDRFARALDPVVSTLDMHGTTAHTRLAQVGPGLEALGYLLMLRDGTSAGKAKETSLRDRLERILKDVECSIPFDGSAWVNSTVSAYNGLKHANRALPDVIDVLNSWRECVLIIRSWVGLELGVEPEAMHSRLKTDPQNAPFVSVG